ncbi:M48 family metallopeptidase [Chryseobacterium sp. SNU WT5]|uniref:M48 family metallopeptidase n=1 Tax=Chryseobacterium sp. SNU WT5 TaxID=2594269 RepID=UPI00117F600B|nr:M48 family metallopeptidase [Chryseobacterium sp. SNU WT5]QDP85586.1 M48 family metallopeptidase [Chryseobacterium sp. SNU WT5]
MKKMITTMLFVAIGMSVNAQINLGKMTKAASKGISALSFSNADAQKLAKEGVAWMDKNNKVAGAKDPYTIRLKKLFAKHQNEDGLPLNYKVYLVSDINAFACADGSVRVFSSLMDVMNDDELLAIIGHEIGHVKNEDSKDAVKSAYLRAAAMDAASASSSTVQTLSQSQLGEFANSILDAKHSKKQESQADDYSYDFMKKHNYNVVGAYTAFKKLALLGGSSKSTSYQKMMSSHPDSEKRAQTIKKRAEKDGVWKDPGEVKLPTEKLKK